MINIHDLPETKGIIDMTDAEASQVTGGSSVFAALLAQQGAEVGRKMDNVVIASKQLASLDGQSGKAFGSASGELQGAMKESNMSAEVLATVAKAGDNLATLVRK